MEQKRASLSFFLQDYPKELIAVYGVPSSGKTSLCLEAALHHLSQGKKVIFIDTEKGFSVERFQQLAGKNYKTYLEKVLLFAPAHFKDQHTTIQSLLPFSNKDDVGLVIVDTIGHYYRRFMKNRPELGNSMLIKQLTILQGIAKKIPVIVSNQVYMSVEENRIKMVGGKILEKRSQWLIELEKEPRRKFILKKPEKRELFFTLTDSGFLFD